MEINEKDQKLLSDIALAVAVGKVPVPKALEDVFTLGYFAGKCAGIEASMKVLHIKAES